MRKQLNTLDEAIVIAFEFDPCAMEERYAAVHFEGANYFRCAAQEKSRLLSLTPFRQSLFCLDFYGLLAAVSRNAGGVTGGSLRTTVGDER